MPSEPVRAARSRFGIAARCVRASLVLLGSGIAYWLAACVLRGELVPPGRIFRPFEAIVQNVEDTADPPAAPLSEAEAANQALDFAADLQRLREANERRRLKLEASTPEGR